MRFYGALEDHSPQNGTNNNSKSSSQQNMFEMQSQGGLYLPSQQTLPYILQNGTNVLRSQSYHGTSSNRRAAMIGENGQISPVSHNSMANFTENDNKFSFGSYAPSHISSAGTNALHQRGFGQLEAGQIRRSVLNFASS